MYKFYCMALVFMSLAFAETGDLQLQHDKYLVQFGDREFTSGTHNILTSEGQKISTYRLANRQSCYYQQHNRAIYRSSKIETTNLQLVLICKERVIDKNNTHTLNYTITWPLVKSSYNQVVVGDSSYLSANNIEAENARAAIRSHADQLYQAFAGSNPEQAPAKLMQSLANVTRLYQLLANTDSTAFTNRLRAPGGAKRISKTFGVTTNNTQIYIDFGYPVISIESIKVKGIGGVAFHGRSAAAPSVIYFAGVAYQHKSAIVTVTVLALPKPVVKKKVVIVNKSANFNVHKTNTFVDFGHPVINLRSLTVTGGAGGVYYREVMGNGVYLKSGVYNKPGYFTVRLQVAVYK